MSIGDGTAFRRARPLLAVSLVNKVASAGLALLPVLVVERGLAPGVAALVLGAARAASVVGTLSSGPLADRYGARAVLLLSFAASAAGVAGMVPSTGPTGLMAAAAVANAGVAMFPVASRLLLTATVPPHEQREALAWLRTVVNLGLAVSFAVSGGLGGERLGALLLLDAASSLAALLLGARWLPEARAAAWGPAASDAGGRVGAFVAMTGLVSGWALVYEAFVSTAAVVLRTGLGPDGVRVFSAAMVTNTVGCTLLGVAAARWIERPDRSVAVGCTLLALGAIVGVGADPAAALAGMALATVGELVWASTAQVVWMALLPAGTSRSTVFSVAMTANFLARAAGSALVFPFLVGSGAPRWAMAALAAPLVAGSWLAWPLWDEYRRVGAVR